MSQMKQGYVTVAAGSTKYLEMAVDLALSLRDFDDRPILLAADRGLASEAQARFGKTFAEVQVLPEAYLQGRHVQNCVVKFACGAISSFEETVFLDADCLIVADTSPLWDNASSEPITMYGEMLTRARDRWHHGFSTIELMDTFDLDRYLKTNSGLFHFRRDGGPEALGACFECHNCEVLERLYDPSHPERRLGDEVAFGIVGGRRGFGRYPSPVPMNRARDLPELTLRDELRPVLHFVAPLARATLDELMAGVRERRASACLARDVSVEHWREKARHPSLVRRLKRFVYRALWSR